MQTEDVREKLFTIRMTDEERERAERIARQYGLNVAGVIRMLLKREDDALQRTAPTVEPRLGAKDLQALMLKQAAELPREAAAKPAKPAKKPSKSKR